MSNLTTTEWDSICAEHVALCDETNADRFSWKRLRDYEIRTRQIRPEWIQMQLERRGLLPVRPEED